MKRNHAIAFGLLALCAITPLSVARASTCEEQAKECFTYTDSERELCIHRASLDKACEKTALGDLVAKRGQLSPASPNDALEGPAFLGPQIVDKKCVANFDTELSAGLIRGALSTETLEALSVSLDRCSRSYAPDITRP